jgi:hypothetical protein
MYVCYKQIWIIAALTIERQINNYLTRLNAKQKKAILIVAKTFAEERGSERKSDIGNDKSFVANIERRVEKMKAGK